jgi:hypothetical protein
LPSDWGHSHIACGDETTLQLLTRLGNDANYPEEARTAFKNAAASLRERLNLPPR